MDSNDMIFDINGEIISQGFNIESLLLKNQYANTDESVLKMLKNTLIPFGLLYKKSNSREKESFLKNEEESQAIDENLYAKLLEDFTFKEKHSRKKSTYRRREKKTTTKKNR